MKPHVKLKVQFGRAMRRVPTPKSERVLRVVRLLALAHALDEQIRAGEIADLADVARQAGLTRARMTQVMNLLQLAPRTDSSRTRSGELGITERRAFSSRARRAQNSLESQPGLEPLLDGSSSDHHVLCVLDFNPTPRFRRVSLAVQFRWHGTP